MTKKIIFLLNFALLVVLDLNAQTKLETEKWLVNKLNKYSAGYYADVPKNYGAVERRYQDNYSFSISSTFLVIQFNEYYAYRETTYRWKKKIMIPINGIAKFNKKSEIYSDVKNCLELILYKNRIYIESDNNKNKSINYIADSYTIPFNFELEDNLVVRMNKALIHLKKFYPRPTMPKETF